MIDPMRYFCLILLIFFLGCDSNSDDSDMDKYIPTPNGVYLIDEDITENTVWTSDKVYNINKGIAITSGNTLTIEPGTIIKFSAGSGVNSCYLFVQQNARIVAEGTQEQPIIFTTIAEDLYPGNASELNFGSKNMNPDIDGLWGGIYIMGNAPISIDPLQEGNTEISSQIVESTYNRHDGTYGGTLPNDNSGILTYVSIRHTGASYGEYSHSGLTLAGVGSETKIENIEVVATDGDGLAVLGGTVNVTNLTILNSGDDAIDTDQAYSGTISNFIAINPKSRVFEIDGPEGDYTGSGHTISNGFVFMGDCFSGYDNDENSDATLLDVYFTGFNENTGNFNEYSENELSRSYNLEMDQYYVNMEGDTIPISAVTYFSEMHNILDANGNPIISTVIPGNNTVGPDDSFEFSWTWTFQSGSLGESGFQY